MATVDPYQSCQDLVRELDRDRYYATLFAPAKYQKHLFALYAFNAEIASTREKISEPMPGEIRLQWWRDTLEKSEKSDNPVANALLQTLRQFNLDPQPLVRLIEARRFDLYDDPMGPFDQFEGYAGETCSILFQYAAMILNNGKDDCFADAAGHAGVAYALTGLLRARKRHSTQRQIFLPSDILNDFDVTEKKIFDDNQTTELKAALAKFAEIAHEHFEQASDHIRKLPKNNRLAFKPLALVPIYLGQGSNIEFTQISNLKKIWCLWRAK